MSAGAHLADALAAEHDALAALAAGEPAHDQLVRARDAYMASHAETGPRSWGRLIGGLKMAILAGDGAEAIAREALAETGDATGSPAAAYARALAGVVTGARPDVAEMLAAGDAFQRTGRALAALAAGDRETYAAALAEIVDGLRPSRPASGRSGRRRHRAGAGATCRRPGHGGRAGQPDGAGRLTA